MTITHCVLHLLHLHLLCMSGNYGADELCDPEPVMLTKMRLSNSPLRIRLKVKITDKTTMKCYFGLH